MWFFKKKKKACEEAEIEDVKALPRVEPREANVSEVEQAEVKTEEIKAVDKKPVVKKESTSEIKEDSEAAVKEASRVYHITKRAADGLWQVRFGGSSKVIKTFDTQAQAIEFTKDLAKKYDRGFIIHKVSGKIRKTTY